VAQFWSLGVIRAMKYQRINSAVASFIILGFAIWLGLRISSGYADLNKTELFESTRYAPEPDDGDKLITDALVMARRDGKRVLLQFGSQGCTWCKVLGKLFGSDRNVAIELNRDFVYVVIDITRGRNKDVDSRYGNPTRNGVPVIVILDADGRRLVTKGDGIVEGDPLRPN